MSAAEADFIYTTTALRVAASFVSEDRGKIAHDLENGSRYMVIGTGTGASTMAALGSEKGEVCIPVGMNWVERDGTVLAAFADGANPQAGFAVDGTEAAGLRWNNHANPDPVATSVAIPGDLDTSVDAEIQILAHKTGATVGDAVTWTCEVFFQSDAALYDADADAGGASSAMTGDATSKTSQLETLTVGNADIPSGAKSMFLTIQPTDGTLGTDDVTITDVRLNYTRKQLT